MRFIFHLLGIIYFAIWIIIGGVVLFMVLSLAKSQPWKMVNADSWSGLTGAFTSAGNVADVIQKIQTNDGSAVEAYNSLTSAQQDCLKKELGSQTINDALSGKTIEPTPDLILKAMKCVN